MDVFHERIFDGSINAIDGINGIIETIRAVQGTEDIPEIKILRKIRAEIYEVLEDIIAKELWRKD